MGSPLPLPTPQPEPAPQPAPRQVLRCEHCGCQLTPTGDVLRMSDDARAHLKATETIAQLRGDLAAVRADLTAAAVSLEAANAEIARLKTPESKPGFLGKEVY